MSAVSGGVRRAEARSLLAMQKTIVFAALALYLLTKLVPVVNHDLWHEMSLARQSIKAGAVPFADVFSYAPTLPVVVDHEWLSGFIALGAYSIPHGIFFLWLAVVVSVVWYIVWALRPLDPPLALLAGFIAGPLAMYSQIVPVLSQAYSVVFAAILLYGFHLHGRGSRCWMALWIPLWLLWVNMHGGMIVGLALVGLFILERMLRQETCRELLGLLVLMGVLVLVNPYGWHYYVHIIRTVTMPRPEIPQWQPNWILGGSWELAWPYLASVAMLTYATWRRGARGAGTVVAWAMALAAVRAHKLLPFYALAWLFWAGKQSFRCSGRLSAAASFAGMAAIPLLALGVAAHRPWAILLPGDSPREFGTQFAQPIGPADYLAERQFRGNVMTYFHHGAYLSWRLYPSVKVSCDARYDVAYPPAHVERNFALYLRSPQILQEELRRLPDTDAILCFRLSALAPELAKLPWQRVYDDDAFILYVRPGILMRYQDRRGEKIRQWL
jgi:hypothetical protein